MTVADRLLANVAVDAVTGCWHWTGYIDPRYGYGQAFAFGKTWRVHRLSYTIHRGPIAGSLLVCHSCDNRACINPKHLFLGTHADNNADMVAKGRHGPCPGTKHGRAKLTEAQVLEIRAADGVSQRELGRRYGVGATQIWLIRNRKNWVHLSDPSA